MKLSLRHFGVALTLLLASCAPAWSMMAAPYPRVFAADNGQVGARLVPTTKGENFGQSQITLFALNADGSDKVLWEKSLPNHPGYVLITARDLTNPYLITLDSWGNAGAAHTLVIYNVKGEIVRDFSGDELLGPEPKPVFEPGQPMTIIMDGGGRNWRNKATLTFSYADFQHPALVIAFEDGRRSVIDLPTGAIVTSTADFQGILEAEEWYRNQAGDEQVFRGKLEAVRQPEGPTTLQRTAFYKLGERTVFTGGKRVAVLDSLVGKAVELRGKAVDMNLEGVALKEIWPASVRARQP